jgi:KilA-N domain
LIFKTIFKFKFKFKFKFELNFIDLITVKKLSQFTLRVEVRLFLNMSTEIRYELIKDEFWYADYLGFKIVMIRNIGYINGTKLCEKGGKKIKDWLNNSNNQDLIMYFNKNINGSFTSLVKCRSVCMEMFSRKGDPNEEIRGTYIHPLLITFIADWISNGFGYIVNHIVDDLNKDLEQKKNLNLEEKLESVTRELMVSLSNFKILERTNIKLRK